MCTNHCHFIPMNNFNGWVVIFNFYLCTNIITPYVHIVLYWNKTTYVQHHTRNYCLFVLARNLVQFSSPNIDDSLLTICHLVIVWYYFSSLLSISSQSGHWYIALLEFVHVTKYVIIKLHFHYDYLGTTSSLATILILLLFTYIRRRLILVE